MAQMSAFDGPKEANKTLMKHLNRQPPSWSYLLEGERWSCDPLPVHETVGPCPLVAPRDPKNCPMVWDPTWVRVGLPLPALSRATKKKEKKIERRRYRRKKKREVSPRHLPWSSSFFYLPNSLLEPSFYFTHSTLSRVTWSLKADICIPTRHAWTFGLHMVFSWWDRSNLPPSPFPTP